MNLSAPRCVLRACIGLALAASAAGAEPVRVVTSTLDMADFVRQIGGDRVSVHSITRGRYDLHAYQPRPSEVMTLRKADMVVVAGMELDAFMPALLNAARNRSLRFGGEGFVDPSVGVEARDVPTGPITGAMGDVHAHGNPHFWFTPDNVATACHNIAAGLARIDPGHADRYRTACTAYVAEVRRTYADLQDRLRPYKGTRVIQFHPSWDYFCDTFGLVVAGDIEPRPGLPPTPGHLSRLADRVAEEDIRLVLAEPFYPERPLRFLQRRSDAKVLRLPLYLGGPPGHTNYLENLTYMVTAIHDALAGPETP